MVAFTDPHTLAYTLQNRIDELHVLASEALGENHDVTMKLLALTGVSFVLTCETEGLVRARD